MKPKMSSRPPPAPTEGSGGRQPPGNKNNPESGNPDNLCGLPLIIPEYQLLIPRHAADTANLQLLRGFIFKYTSKCTLEAVFELRDLTLFRVFHSDPFLGRHGAL